MFEIDFTNRALVHELQNTISRISNDRLARAINDCFERLIPEDALIKLDSLTIDIGEIAYDLLDKELEGKVIGALEEKITQLILSLRRDGYSSAAEDAVITPISSNEEILEHFLLNGTLPWWVQQDSQFRLDTIIEALFQQEPELLRAMVVRIGRNEFVRRRLVQQFSSEAIQKIVTVLEPAEAAYIIGYQAEVVALQKTEQVIKTEIAVFEKAVWLFVLNYLLDERGGDFNRKAFVKSNLVQMAAYFNVAYFELLTVFYKAIASYTTDARQVGSLEIFIRELTAEEESVQAQQFTAVLYSTDTSKRKDAITLAAKADMLVYFFRYGTLPAGNNGYSISALADIFSELVRDIPLTLRTMLYELRFEARFTDNFYALLGTERSKELLNNLYPGTARLLTTFSSLVEWIQTNKKVFDADVVMMKQALSHIALSHIVFAEASVSEKELLQSFILELSNRYHVDPAQLTIAIQEALQETFRQGIMNSNLPGVMKILAEEALLKSDPVVPQSLIPQLGDDEANAQKGLLDTLTYLVQYGNIPWWGKRFFEGGTTDDQFRALMLASPQQTNELIRMAGSDQRWQRRLLSFVSVDTMYNMIALLPFGKEGVMVVKQVLTWLEKGIKGDDETSAKIILQSFWTDLAAHAYRSFSMTGFYSISIVRIAVYLDITPLAAAQMFEKASARKGAGTAQERDILADLVQVFTGNEENATGSKKKEELKRRSGGSVSPDIQKDQELEVMLMLSTSLPQDGIVTGEKLNKEALRLLEYFFTWNKLPAEWDETPYLPLTVMLKQMLLLVFRENRTALQNLLLSTAHIPAARIFFHELVTASKGGNEKEVALFIKPYKEAYQQIFFDTERTIALQQRDSERGRVVDAGGSLTATGHADWIEWIGFFLSTGSFPNQVASEEKLREIIIQLYLLDRNTLKKIFDKKDHQPFARIRLHDMFMGQAGYLERGIIYLLDPYRQADLVALLNAKDIGIDIGDREKVLLRLLTPGKKVKDITELRQLVISSPVFIQHLTTDLGEQGLKIFMERTGAGWGQDTTDTMLGLRNILSDAVPGNLERDKLLALLLQFNLLFLSGKLYIRSGKAYFQAFFAYLQQSISYGIPVSVWKAVLGYISDEKRESAVLPEEPLQTFKKEIISLIRRSAETPIPYDEPVSKTNDEELLRKKQAQLEAIRAELEKERIREQEQLEKEFRKLQEDKNNKIYIRNAGLVLLHPFLGTYFKRLGLLEDGKFVDDAAQHRAVLLLQYLVNGRTIAEEFELALNKILCGLPIEEAVPLEFTLTEDEIAVSAEIFQVIFQRWEKMKNTSVEGFRASFIQREGALSRLEENWELRVEQRTYDMLLTTLPWAFGMIKNTWMTKILTVEWT